MDGGRKADPINPHATAAAAAGAGAEMQKLAEKSSRANVWAIFNVFCASLNVGIFLTQTKHFGDKCDKCYMGIIVIAAF